MQEIHDERKQRVEIPCNDGKGRGGGVCWEEGGSDEVLAIPMARGREVAFEEGKQLAILVVTC